MTNTVFGRLFYLNNYSKFSGNPFIKEKLPEYIDAVLYAKDASYILNLVSLKDGYNHDNYMYILESIINYVIKVFNLTFQDYVTEGYDKAIEPVLKNIVNKHNELLKLYNLEFEQEQAKKEKKANNFAVYRNSGLKKHKVYTVNNYKK